MKPFRAVCLSAVSAALLALPAFGQAVELTPRKPLPKAAVVQKPALPTGRLIVKFKDETQARIRTGKVKSTVGADLRQVDALTQQFGLEFKPLFGDKTEQALRLVEIRAAAYSGKGQPDLAGMMYVDGPQEELDNIAMRLNALNVVEFVQYDQHYVTAGGGAASCGMSGGNDCFDASANTGPYCDGDDQCCQLVCQIRPFCCQDPGGEWDVLCADLANLFCPCAPPCFGMPPDRCNAPILGGGCFETHPFGGCSDSACCTVVCGIDPNCCVVDWDELCVTIAQENCEIDDPGVTPDFTESNPDSTMRRQKYRTPGPSADFFAQTGFSGEGYDLQGLWEMGEFLLDLGIGEQNLAHGMGRRVAIIEHSASVPVSTATGHAQNDPGHEDLSTVICEPGQTPILLNVGLISSNHGTACLGIAVGEENGFGVTGIARHAQGYFFPIVSQESGGRLFAAVLSCIELFEPGDVMSFSIGPGGVCGTLVSSPAEWAIIRLASDLGITSCIAAGNFCCNLDDGTQPGDSGAIIVGACWPGALNDSGIPPKYCRLGFSNHCEDCNEEDDDYSNVHCAAWGIQVASCGYGDLHGSATDLNTQYTAAFSGTSAACPQVAGLIACLQGISVQFHGIALTPEQIRSTLALAPQCSSLDPPGSPQEPRPCGGDFDPNEPPNRIRGYPAAVESAVLVFASGFFDDAPGVRDITVVWGEKIFGNLFSIKGLDNNFYIIESARRFAGNGSSPSGHHLTYLGTGQVTDVIVGAKSENPQPGNSAAVAGTLALQATGPVILFIEFFNWNTGRFDRWGFEFFLDGIGGGFGAFPAAGTPTGRYVRPSDGRIEVRLWTLGFTANHQPYRVLYDLINVGGTNDVGPNPDGGGGLGSGG